MILGAASMLGCMGRHQALEPYAAHADWVRQQFATNTFILTGMLRQQGRKSAPLAVYIEGDGLAWLSQYEKSSDPTPRDPLVAARLELGIFQPALDQPGRI